MRRVRRNFPGVAGWGKVSLVFQTAAANVVEYELRRRVIAFQNLRHGHLPLATLLQPHALVGLAWCNRNAVPMHNQTVIDRNDARLYDFIQPMPCSRGFQSYVPDILTPVSLYCFGAIVAYFWRQIYSELASYLSSFGAKTISGHSTLHLTTQYVFGKSTYITPP